MSYAIRIGHCDRFPTRGDRLDCRPVAIAKTIELQAEIDRVIAAAGGFPDAFR